MSKPSFASITETPCKCGYLEDSANNPDLPITYRQDTNEYDFVYLTNEGGKGFLRIFHCPFCGGTAPKSLRHLFFAVISRAENNRLSELLADIKTVDDALRVLGPPDIDNLEGVKSEKKESDGSPPLYEHKRTLGYVNLSEVAEVWFTVQLDEYVHYHLQGKYIGKPEDK